MSDEVRNIDVGARQPVDEEISKNQTNYDLVAENWPSRPLTFFGNDYHLFVQAVDKGASSFASIMGLQEDTNRQGSEENYIIQRVPIAKWLGINVFLWGATVALMAAWHNVTGLVTVRAFLGAFEAVCQPTFTVLSGMYMMNGLQQIFGGLLAFVFTHIPASSPVSDWPALFMTHGLIAAVWGIFIIYWMLDSQMKAKCFSEEDKKLMVERVRVNQTGIQNRKFRADQVKEAFLDPQIYASILI
ncbi:hypothetical protein SCAR479_08971 [Seiridium cardinale]|uniref:Major facilitator superfamily (MFS) profile domain-containing protein n=1 Tax=Seiridium cardinale TaxID=138064 RepID=A0ABR2XKS2_9PEZI